MFYHFPVIIRDNRLDISTTPLSLRKIKDDDSSWARTRLLTT
ncbi:MAG: hypothetical protein FD130_1489 [Halothiobacillaceae bacterium]|nr:MAG: hypothetical protein FD130_1489 [Halothiobacillaceae bacterium]